MAWPKSGTVSVTNGSPVVIGSGTNFFGSAQAGWAFVGPDGRVYEVMTADSATQITLASNYQGATASGQVYALFPTMSLARDLVAAVQSLIGNYQGIADGPGAGKFAGDVVKQGDEDTGLSWPASNTVALKAGGIEQLRMTGGVASGAAVQSSATDGAVGRLLKLAANGGGAFGLGATSPAFVADLDDHNTPAGFYGIQTSTLGTRPSGASSFGFLVLFRQSLTGVCQVYVNSNGQLAACRTATAGVWDAWKKFVTDADILGTVSQSGGVPTGAVIERGSNANGEYVRFADGTQICTHEMTLAAPNVAHGQIYADAGATTWTYPASFISGATVSAHNVDVGSCFFAPYGNSNGSCGLRVLRAVSSAAAPVVRLMATGRWF